MAFVSLVRSQCLSRFLARRSTPLRRSMLSIHSPDVRPFPPLRRPGFFPRTPMWNDVPLTTTALFLARHFSRTPAPRKEKHENIYTLPNILTFSRIIATPIIAYLILDDKPYLATSLLLYAGLTDLIDGWIARRYNLKSVVGTVIDPMADKFLMITLTGALAYTSAMPSSPLSPNPHSHLPRPLPCPVLALRPIVNSSLACGDYPGKRLWFGHCSNILSIHFTTPSQNIHAILGLFASLR